MYYKLYTLDNKFIKETHWRPDDFTGIVECVNGSKFWYLNGKFHRIDGPACEYQNGDKWWYVNGKLHRLDGPAVEYRDGTKEWYLNDKPVSGEQHKLYVDIMKLKGLI